ncbi:MAG TPA: hypothetical protein DCL76_08990 [Chloroflexi bacterium]|nr:hypothetical protein [Chloroflexota bacterium]HCU98180.1 hypothetical protein [Chloroflexota bacterium]|tara:strand:+ start:3290 stop:3622 length:333 start_codon:yes stop_codon:yes gene_type:complete
MNNDSYKSDKYSSESLKERTLKDLLSTSHAIKKTLNLITPRESFVKELRQNLDNNVENVERSIKESSQKKQQLKWTVIGAGIGIYTISLLVTAIRFIKWFSSTRNTKHKQ